jgi:hypothetical protein
MRALRLYGLYSRRDVHSIFSPETRFIPQAGTWGLQGIIDIPDHPGDYVFFVTFGKSQGEHKFDEEISDDGVLTWQSQPKQTLEDQRIQDFIGHREETNTIHLFLRPDNRSDYFYLGRLKYLEHDPSREKPVYFRWQILHWSPPRAVIDAIGRSLIKRAVENRGLHADSDDQMNVLIETSAPQQRAVGRVNDQAKFTRQRRPDYLANHAANEELGLLGEKLVLRMERERLASHGRPDLAECVRHVSLIEFDCAGYDILSFELDGRKRFIEVKTTCGGIDADFFMSANELAFSERQAAAYFLYRLYEFNRELNSAKYFVLTGALAENAQLTLLPTNFRVGFTRRGLKARTVSDFPSLPEQMLG